MTALDIIVLLLVGLGVFTGLRKGFVHAVLSLGVWVVVVLALWVLHGPVQQGLSGVVGTASSYVLAFIVLLVGTWIAAKLLVAKIGKGVRRSFVGSADRLLGALFGGLKGLIFVTLFYMAFSFVYDSMWGREARRPAWIADAFTYPLVHGSADIFVDVVGRRQSPRNDDAAGNKAAPKAR